MTKIDWAKNNFCISCKILLFKNGTNKLVLDSRMHKAHLLCTYCYNIKYLSGVLQIRNIHAIEDNKRMCRKCTRILNVNMFKTELNYKHKISSICKKCEKLWERYKLTYAEFISMHVSQNYSCATCKRKVKLYVDHCHISGKVRGLLCNTCNLGLGAIHDSKYSLRQSADYLSVAVYVNLPDAITYARNSTDDAGQIIYHCVSCNVQSTLTLCTQCSNRLHTRGIYYSQFQYLTNIKKTCQICDKSFDIVKGCVDHDHVCCPSSRNNCGKCVRGLLCSDCNTFLGLVNDDILIIANMILYLDRNH